jgi:hypothetical protein
MSTRLHHKTCLGKHFSEGSRRLWLLLEERGWHQGNLAADVLAARSPGAPVRTGVTTSVVNRWLYGDRAPDRASALLLQERYGLDPKLWDQAPQEPFTPPAAREAA